MKEKMKVVIDIETNSLENPSKIWCVVCREVDTDEVHIFEKLHESSEAFNEFRTRVSCWIGHNLLGFDLPTLSQFGVFIDSSTVIDTLVVSRLINFGIEGGHSLEAWGNRLGEKKIGLDISDWTVYNKEFLSRCIQDTYVNLKLFKYLERYIYNKSLSRSLRLEHNIALICNQIHLDGFSFDKERALLLLKELQSKLEIIDNQLSSVFPPKRILLSTLVPRYTKQGAIYAVDYRRLTSAGFKDSEITDKRDVPYGIWEERPYNPNSLHETIDRLWDSGWKPSEKTKGHLDATSSRRRDKTDRDDSIERLERFKRYGWKLSEENLRTLPDTAPEAARSLVERLLLASRVSDLEEWIGLCRLDSPVKAPSSLTSEFNLTEGYHPTSQDEYRIHGSFQGIGAWTHRLASNKPNMQNIPVPQNKDNPSKIDLLSDEINGIMRSLWISGRRKRLIGVDADGIQMRVFAHYVNDTRLIKALVEGKKSDGTDIHSLHWKALGNVCPGRNPAKTFIYAWLLGAGAAKVAEIFGCSISSGKDAINKFIDFYPGLKELKSRLIPDDAKRGYFEGLDGRLVICPDEHRVLAGYLQAGEAVIMKRATVEWQKKLKHDRIPFKLVTWPHDEWQTEVEDNDEIANYVQEVQIQAIVKQGAELGLNCPLAASGRQGYNWQDTH